MSREYPSGCIYRRPHHCPQACDTPPISARSVRSTAPGRRQRRRCRERRECWKNDRNCHDPIPPLTEQRTNLHRLSKQQKKKAGLPDAAMQLVTFGSPAFLVSGPVTFRPYVTAGLALSCNNKSVSTPLRENLSPIIHRRVESAVGRMGQARAPRGPVCVGSLCRLSSARWALHDKATGGRSALPVNPGC